MHRYTGARRHTITHDDTYDATYTHVTIHLHYYMNTSPYIQTRVHTHMMLVHTRIHSGNNTYRAKCRYAHIP